MLTVKVGKMIDAATAIEASSTYGPQVHSKRTYQATVTGSGAVSATVSIEGSNDQVAWVVIATLSPSGTTTATDGAAVDEAWGYARADLTAISGTSAACTVTAASQ